MNRGRLLLINLLKKDKREILCEILLIRPEVFVNISQLHPDRKLRGWAVRNLASQGYSGEASSGGAPLNHRRDWDGLRFVMGSVLD